MAAKIRPAGRVGMTSLPDSMKYLLSACALLGAFAFHTVAAEKPVSAAVTPVTLTFYVAGMECAACTDFVNQSVFQVKGVKDVQPWELGVLNISYDAEAATAHQVAQAVTEAVYLHGRPYEATLRFRVPDYARDGNAARVDAIFAAQKDWVKIETLDKDKGEFAVHFLPLKPDQRKGGAQGWSPDRLTRALRHPAPQGLGLAVAMVKEGQPEPAPTAGSAKK